MECFMIVLVLISSVECQRRWPGADRNLISARQVVGPGDPRMNWRRLRVNPRQQLRQNMLAQRINAQRFRRPIIPGRGQFGMIQNQRSWQQLPGPQRPQQWRVGAFSQRRDVQQQQQQLPSGFQQFPSAANIGRMASLQEVNNRRTTFSPIKSSDQPEGTRLQNWLPAGEGELFRPTTSLLPEILTRTQIPETYIAAPPTPNLPEKSNEKPKRAERKYEVPIPDAVRTVRVAASITRPGTKDSQPQTNAPELLNYLLGGSALSDENVPVTLQIMRLHNIYKLFGGRKTPDADHKDILLFTNNPGQSKEVTEKGIKTVLSTQKNVINSSQNEQRFNTRQPNAGNHFTDSLGPEISQSTNLNQDNKTPLESWNTRPPSNLDIHPEFNTNDGIQLTENRWKPDVFPKANSEKVTLNLVPSSLNVAIQDQNLQQTRNRNDMTSEQANLSSKVTGEISNQQSFNSERLSNSVIAENLVAIRGAERGPLYSEILSLLSDSLTLLEGNSTEIQAWKDKARQTMVAVDNIIHARTPALGTTTGNPTTEIHPTSFLTQNSTSTLSQNHLIDSAQRVSTQTLNLDRIRENLNPKNEKQTNSQTISEATTMSPSISDVLGDTRQLLSSLISQIHALESEVRMASNRTFDGVEQKAMVSTENALQTTPSTHTTSPMPTPTDLIRASSSLENHALSHHIHLNKIENHIQGVETQSALMNRLRSAHATALSENAGVLLDKANQLIEDAPLQTIANKSEFIPKDTVTTDTSSGKSTNTIKSRLRDSSLRPTPENFTTSAGPPIHVSPHTINHSSDQIDRPPTRSGHHDQSSQTFQLGSNSPITHLNAARQAQGTIDTVDGHYNVNIGSKDAFTAGSFSDPTHFDSANRGLGRRISSDPQLMDAIAVNSDSQKVVHGPPPNVAPGLTYNAPFVHDSLHGSSDPHSIGSVSVNLDSQKVIQDPPPNVQPGLTYNAPFVHDSLHGSSDPHSMGSISVNSDSQKVIHGLPPNVPPGLMHSASFVHDSLANKVQSGSLEAEFGQRLGALNQAGSARQNVDQIHPNVIGHHPLSINGVVSSLHETSNSLHSHNNVHLQSNEASNVAGRAGIASFIHVPIDRLPTTGSPSGQHFVSANLTPHLNNQILDSVSNGGAQLARHGSHPISDNTQALTAKLTSEMTLISKLIELISAPVTPPDVRQHLLKQLSGLLVSSTSFDAQRFLNSVSKVTTEMLSTTALPTVMDEQSVYQLLVSKSPNMRRQALDYLVYLREKTTTTPPTTTPAPASGFCPPFEKTSCQGKGQYHNLADIASYCNSKCELDGCPLDMCSCTCVSSVFKPQACTEGTRLWCSPTPSWKTKLNMGHWCFTHCSGYKCDQERCTCTCLTLESYSKVEELLLEAK